MQEFTERDVRTWQKEKATGIYYVVVAGQDGRWRSSGMTDKAQAIAWALRQARGGFSETSTLSEFAGDFFTAECSYVRSKQDGGAVRTSKHWHELRVILTEYLLPKWGGYQMGRVLPGAFHEWLATLRGTKTGEVLAPATRRKVLFATITIWNWAVFKGVLTQNTLLTIPRIGGAGVKRRAFRKDELLAMFPDPLTTVWPERWGLFFLIAAETGLRPQEVCALHWEDWRPAHKAFIVSRAVDEKGNLKGLKTSAKGVAKKAAPVSDRVADMLDKTPATARHGLLFHWTNADGETRPARVDTAGKAFCAGLDGIKGFKREGRTLYSLRHAANTRFVTELGGQQARELMGHTTAGMTANYDDPEEIDLLRRVGR